MYQIKLQSFPNREMRATLTKIRGASPARAPLGSDEGESPSTPTSPRVLDISSELETPPLPVRRRARFGLNARRTIIRAGGALQEFDATPTHYLFFTGTLPGSTPRAMAAISAEASWIIHRFKAWIAKRLTSKFDFYVWEMQKRGAIHLHYCLYCPDAALRLYFRENFHEEWCRLMDGVGARQGTNVYQKGFGDGRSTRREVVQAYCQEVRTSVCGYMAKYCSKGDSKNDSRWERYFPKRWWGCSRPLLALLREKSAERVIQITSLSEARRLLYKFQDELAPLALKVHSYYHRAGLGQSTITYFLGASWQMAKKMVSKKFALVSAAEAGTFSSPPYLQRCLAEVSDVMLGLKKVCPAFGFGEAPLLVEKLANLRTLSSLHTPDSLREWHYLFTTLSLEITPMRIGKYLSLVEMERYRLLLRSFWKIRDSGYDRGNWDADRCYELSRFLYHRVPRKYSGTTTSESGRGTRGGSSESGTPELPLSPLQLELELDGIPPLGGDRRGR